MFGKLFTSAMISDQKFRNKYQSLLNKAVDKARENMYIGDPENVGEIVLSRWFENDELYKEYDDLLVDIVDAADTTIMEDNNNE